ncbi:HAD domain-containing protein [Arthrobacter terrae]|uniref:HAD domain-containing protein n=1 Tax=Arthrobacter terrae TaxID=2935737 RepID=UPI0028A8CB70|nr:HAD domain-containing protein [Arthrobacter terrae]
MNVTIYSDADGIFVAWSDHRFTPAPAEHTGWTGPWHHVTIPGSFPGYWSEDVVEAMNRIAAHPDVTVKWLTAWEEGAPEQLAPVIGLDGAGWEMIQGVEDDDPANGNWWKLAKIRDYVARNRPDKLVWMDDDINFDPASLAWLKSLDIPVLVICPKTAHGLTRDHMAEIEAFIGKQ